MYSSLTSARNAAEGAQNVHAEAQAERIGRHAAHALDQQGNDQPDAQEEELEDDDADEQQDQRAGFIGAAAVEHGQGNETDRPDHQVGDGQAGQGRQQLAGQHLQAADRLGQQEVGGQFVLFDRDQAEAVVAGLDGQAELDEGKDEAVKTQHGRKVDVLHAEGGQQRRRES